tara:strand:+ start:9530 stop:12952 length:3423 start_codon:yes stop_codon:yes gene_type:complete
MAVTQRHMGAGNFSVTFSQEFTPTEIVEAIKEWGHIVITPQEIDTSTLTDSEIKDLSIYTGIVLNRTLEEGVVSINGQGLQLYMGDGAAKGMVIAESNNVGKVRNYTGTTLAETLFNSTAQTNKPLGIMRDEAGNLQAITQGTITNPAGTYTGSHFVETSLSALKFVSEVLNTEYRVNMNGTLDAGPAANLFKGVGTATPETIVVKTAYGQDPNLEGVVPQGLRTEFDATDFVTRVDFTGEVGFFDTATDVAGEANLSSIPYKDLHGNALKRVALVQEPDVPEALLNSRAQSILNELSRVKKVLNLDLEQYEVQGDMKPGDFIFAFDPDIGFVDTATEATAESRSLFEVAFRGQTINPVKVRVKGITWPITNGMGCYFRDKDGNYTDLSQYVNYESGSAQVELGDVLRTIGDDLRFSEFSLSREQAGVFSIPDLPSTPTLQSGTYLDSTGISKGFIRVVVSRPTNTDGSQITDGQSYRVRYKKIGDAQYSFQSFPYTGVATESLLIQDLTVGTTYQVGVHVVDKSGFKKMSAFDGSGEDLYTDSSSVNANFATNARVEIQKDGQAPSKPKQATSIATGPLKVQITHHLGKDGTDGNGNPFGNFTLEGDLDYLAVHAVTQSGNTANFTVSSSNKIGEIRVTAGNLLQQIPLVGSADLADSSGHFFRFVAVDKSGNASNPSDGQTGTASLIEETHIKDATITDVKIGTAQITGAKIANATITDANIASLNADKITAGSIDASQIAVTNLSASNITSGTISADRISGGSIDAGLITSGTMSADRISGGSISGDVISGGTIEGTTINAGNLTISGQFAFGDLNISSGDIVGRINSNALDGGKITDGTVSNAKVGNLSADKITTGSMSAARITSGTMSADRISGGSIDAGIITSGTMSADRISGGTLQGLTISGATISAVSVSSVGGVSAGGAVTGSSATFSGITKGSTFQSSNNSSNIGFGTTSVFIRGGGSTNITAGSTNKSHGHWAPSINNLYDLGTTSLKWDDVRATNSVIQTSDINLKDNVVTTDLGLDFINDLTPIEYTWKAFGGGEEDDETIDPIAGTRTHLGFSAQDIKEKLIIHKGDDQNIAIYTESQYADDFDEENDTNEYGLRTGELIPVLTKAIQELSEKVDSLTARIEVLEG